jgi:hypothetical protein
MAERNQMSPLMDSKLSLRWPLVPTATRSLAQLTKPLVRNFFVSPPYPPPPPYPFVGTSMATPIVAGAAIILREYFLEHYRTLCVSAYQYCKAFAPSGDSP